MTDQFETLHVYDLDGKLLAEHDLAQAGTSVQVIRSADGTVGFVDVVAAGQTVVAALVRDEDGWTLVAAEAEHPVVSGSNEAPDAHLTAGIPCRIDQTVFRLERSQEASGSVLVWRYAGSPVSVDVVQDGRNTVGIDRELRHPSVNAMMAESVLFDFYPTADGIDVATSGDSAGRLSVPPLTLFSVGSFEGMLMSSAQAATALKASSPFAWPSRRLRLELLVTGLVLVGIFALVALLRAQTARVERLNAEPHGAVEVALSVGGAAPAHEDDIVYDLAFIRSLPAILTAEPNAVTLDLIQRGEQLAKVNHDAAIARKVKFLKDVRAIQETIRTGRWDDFSTVFAKIDREMFMSADADEFMADADEVATFLTRTVTGRLSEVIKPGQSQRMETVRREIQQSLDDLKDNLFMTGEVLQREYENIKFRIETVDRCVKARDAVLAALDAKPVSLRADQIAELCRAWEQALSVRDAGVADEKMLDAGFMRSREQLKDIVMLALAYVEDGKAESGRAKALMLEPLADLAAACGMEEARLKEWRARARQARKEFDRRAHELYSRYRRECMRDPDGSVRMLDEILSLGVVDSTFHVWALREKARIDQEKKEKAQ